MFRGFDLEPDFLDASIGRDEKRDAMDAHVFFAKERFLSPDAVSFDDLFVFVCEQSEREFVFLHELVVRFHRVNAYA